MTRTLIAITLLSTLVGCGSDSSTNAKSASYPLAPPQSLAAPSEFQSATTETQSVRYTADLYGSGASVSQFLEPEFSVQSSTEFWKTVTGAELNRGVTLPLTQGSSLIRLSPGWDNRSGTLIRAEQIAPGSVALLADGKVALNQSSAAKSQPSLLSPIAIEGRASTQLANQSVFAISDQVVAGDYQLSVSDRLDPNGLYYLHVNEKGSPYSLTAKVSPVANSSQFAISTTLGAEALPLGSEISATLQLPQGKQIHLPVVRSKNGHMFDLPKNLKTQAPAHTIVLSTESNIDGTVVQRNIKAAVKPKLMTASFGEQLNATWQQQDLASIVLPVTVSQAGRYQVSVVLEATAADGQKHPAQQLNLARWLEAGDHQFDLSVDNDLLTQHGLTAPFGIALIELKDQSQLATLDQQQLTLELNPTSR